MADKRIKDLSTEITSFRTGDFIAVDGTSGTAKMSKNNVMKNALGNVHLLDEVTSFAADAKILVDSETNGPGAMPADTLQKLTAQNALAGNVAPAFDPTRTSDNPYKAGESVVYSGETYVFKFNHYGEWSSSDVFRLEGGFISMRGIASVLGIKDANNAPIGSVIWSQTNSTYSHFPQESGNNLSGNLFTFSNKHDYTEQYVTQMFFDISGNMWVRFKQYGGTWTSWSRQANEGDISSLSSSVNSRLRDVLKLSGNATTANLKDADSAVPGTCYWCQTNSTYSNFPQDSGGTNLSGHLVTLAQSYSATSQYVTQMFFDISGNMWVRFKQYGGTWTSWSRQANTSDISSLSTSFNNKLLNYPKMSGTAVSIGLKDADNALPATFYWVQLDATYSNFPEGVAGGNLLTLLASISLTDQYVTQMFFDILGAVWVRFKQYGSSWTAWSRQANASDMAVYAGLKDALNYPDLSMFQRVGVVGDSYASAALYTPEGSPIGDVYPLSWPQILGRKTGCTWINFTQGGLSTRSWLSSASHGLPALLTENPCDLYILVLGINDTAISNYLGSIADITEHSSYEDYPDTFYGNYGKIFEQIIEHAPAAKIIFSTMSNNSVGTYRSYNEAIVEIADHYNVPVVKQFEDGFFSSAVYTSMYGQHPTKAGQAGMATAFERMIQKSIVSNLTYYNSLVGG